LSHKPAHCVGGDTLHNTDEPSLIYASVDLDRASHKRRDEAWLAAARDHPDTRILPMYGLRCVVEMAKPPRLIMPRLGSIRGLLPEDLIFLGLLDDTPVFVAEIAGLDDGDWDYAEVRTVAKDLPPAQAGLLAFARGIMHWTIRHRYCGSCGSATVAIDAGHARRCQGCGLDSFPRTDPAVIMLIHDGGDRCILGRSKRLPSGVYSTLAGFVEPGETIEQTVSREVFEEVGVHVSGLRYRASQPWPFPQSLMLGFHGETAFGPLRVDPEEMDDARWFSRDELRDPAKRPVQLPNADSIARYLIERWLAGR